MSDTITVNLDGVYRAIDRLEYNLGNVIDHQVGAVRNDLKTTQDDLEKLRDRLEEYIAEDERRSSVQRAETKKGSLAAEIDRIYGHYRIVRRTSVGILQAVDVDNVQENTIRSVTEELMIQSPNYWLAPVVVSLAAWLRDDRETAERSLKVGLERDPAKTALFYSLVLRRENRMESASAWLKVYFRSLDPRRLGREFAVILECISSGAFGVSGVDFILQQFQDWNALLRDDESIIKDEIAKWQTGIKALADNPDLSHFKTLKSISPDWSRIEDMLRSVSGMCNFKARMSSLSKKSVEKNLNMVDLLDDILELLVTEYETTELPKRRELAEQQAIIDAEGHKAKMRDLNVISQAALEENFNLLQMQDVCVFVPENIGVSVGTQKVAFGASKDIAHQSLSQYTKTYRQSALDKAALNFDANHSEYARQFQYVGAKMDTATNQQQAEKQITSAWMRSLEPYIASAQEIHKTAAIAVGVIGAIIGIIALAGAAIAGVIILIITVGIVFAIISSEKSKAAQRVSDLEATRNKAILHSIQVYRDAIAEWTDVRLDYEDLDSEEAGLVSLIDSWPSGRELLSGVE